MWIRTYVPLKVAAAFFFFALLKSLQVVVKIMLFVVNHICYAVIQMQYNWGWGETSWKSRREHMSDREYVPEFETKGK